MQRSSLGCEWGGGLKGGRQKCTVILSKPWANGCGRRRKVPAVSFPVSLDRWPLLLPTCLPVTDVELKVGECLLIDRLLPIGRVLLGGGRSMVASEGGFSIAKASKPRLEQQTSRRGGRMAVHWLLFLLV